jgi:5-methylcytosine-specific restriction endonuclease McrA
MKTCHKCGVEKPVEMFSVHKSRRDGLACNCKACEAARNKAWHESNKERAAANRKAWYESNRDRKAAQVKAWRENNRERVSATYKAWCEANPDYNKTQYEANRESAYARCKAWYAAHPEAKLALNAKRRALKRNADGTYSAVDIKRIRDEQNDCCVYCKAALNGKGHVDHVQPLAKGGTNWPDNIQLLCKSCNSRKHAKDPVAHIAQLGIISFDEAAFLATLPLTERIVFVRALAL